MKKVILKIGKTGKIIGATLAIITGIFSLLGIIETYSTKDIAGEWYLEFKTDKSSYKPYIGETHTQKIFFIQSGDKIIGNGEKWEYNGKLLDFSAHRKLEYEGTVDGNELKAKYILHGRDRVSDGIICVEINNDGKTMTGTFSGSAANSSGSIKGKKEN